MFTVLTILSPYRSRDGRKFFFVISIYCHHIHDFRVRFFKFNYYQIASHLTTLLQEEWNGVCIRIGRTIILNILPPTK